MRLVDVESALRARSYASGEQFVLEVKDEFCPWNDGCYRIEEGKVSRAKGGGGHAPPDLVALFGAAAEQLLAEDVLARLGAGDRAAGPQESRRAPSEAQQIYARAGVSPRLP